MSARETSNPALEGIAMVGMAGRFPGAGSVAEFWKHQLNGIESISHFRADELEVPAAAELARDPNYIVARSVLDDVDQFDADFFGIYPREAELMDPQQRLFLECCWQALEDAGYDPGSYPGAIGVYAGCSTSTYFLSRLCGKPGFIESFTGAYQVGNYPEMMGNNVDFLATRVAYKLNLRGPAFTMQAGCSTSLLATTQACQSLLTYQCDMALAGGSSITFPQKRGSYYQEGGMISPDGHCRAFDANAQGTVFGSGVGVVLLKRCEDAVRDGDQIYAVIRGFAANNDGASKVGYTAPSVEGQARVIALAQAAAGVDAETIGYIEAHGTGTPLGDPIELAALTQAFGSQTQKKELLRDWHGKNQRRTSGHCSWRDRADSCQPHRAPWRAAAHTSLQEPESEIRFGQQPFLCEFQPDPVAGSERTAKGGSERVRRGRHQCARGSGGSTQTAFERVFPAGSTAAFVSTVRGRFGSRDRKPGRISQVTSRDRSRRRCVDATGGKAGVFVPARNHRARQK